MGVLFFAGKSLNPGHRGSDNGFFLKNALKCKLLFAK
jgi:hypothetical protein